MLWEGNPRISGREEVGIARHSPSGARVAARTHNSRKGVRLHISLSFGPDIGTTPTDRRETGRSVFPFSFSNPEFQAGF